MIKFNIDVRDFNKMNKFGKRFNSKDNSRPALKFSQLTIKGDTLKVEGLDGYKLFTLNLEIENINNKDGILYLEPMNNFKISSNTITVAEEENEIRVSDIRNEDIRITKKEELDFFDTDKVHEDELDSIFEITFTVEHLRDALRAYESGDIVDLKFYDKHKQVIINNNLDAKSLVLPVRRNN